MCRIFEVISQVFSVCLLWIIVDRIDRNSYCFFLEQPILERCAMEYQIVQIKVTRIHWNVNAHQTISDVKCKLNNLILHFHKL